MVFSGLNHNLRGIAILSEIPALGLLYSYVRYKAKTNVNKVSSKITQIIGWLYGTASTILVFLFLIHLFSFINGYPLQSNCVIEDETCIVVSPYFSRQANFIYHKLPVTFRSTPEEMMKEINEWAMENTNWAYTEGNDLHAVIITYWTFLNDFKVHVRQCKESQNFVSVLVQAQSRMGYKDFGNQLEERVRSLYKYLQTKYKPTEYSYRFCVAYNQIQDLL